MGRVQRVALENSFDANATYVPAGHIGTFEEELLNGKEEHLIDPAELPPPAIVQVAPLGPTGPNPTAPQQIPPDAVQLPGGGYGLPGKRLVGEVTQAAEVRLADILDSDEAAVSEALSDAGVDQSLDGQRTQAIAGTASIPAGNEGGRGSTSGNADDALVAGTVADVTKDLGTKSDAELEAIKAAENDREQPRVGVLKAVDAELDSRKQNAQS